MRTPVPKSLWSCLSQVIPGSTHAEHRAMLGQALAERGKRMEAADHQAHNWLCSNPVPLDPILWAHPPDPLHPFSVSHGTFDAFVPIPPQTCPTYQHPPILPGPALKKPSQSVVQQNHSQPSVARLETPHVHPGTHEHLLPPPPPPQLFHALLNTHAHGNDKNAYGCFSANRPPSLGCRPNAQKPPALSHPHAPDRATVKHA